MQNVFRNGLNGLLTYFSQQLQFSHRGFAQLGMNRRALNSHGLSSFVFDVAFWVQDFHFGNARSKDLDDSFRKPRRYALDTTFDAGHVSGVEIHSRSQLNQRQPAFFPEDFERCIHVSDYALIASPKQDEDALLFIASNAN